MICPSLHTEYRPTLQLKLLPISPCGRRRDSYTVGLNNKGDQPGSRELSESCVSHNSRSLETKQPCVRPCPSTGRGFGGVIPREIFCNIWANLHSEPFPGKNDSQNYIQPWTCVWAKFSLFFWATCRRPIRQNESLHHSVISVDSIVIGDSNMWNRRREIVYCSALLENIAVISINDF